MVLEDKQTEKELCIVLHGVMCGQRGSVDKHTLYYDIIRHPLTRQLVANQVLVAVFEPFGGKALLTLVEVAIRITDGSRKHAGS